MTAQQLKNAILQLAIQGKLVPQDPKDEPASALLAQIRQEKAQLVKAGNLKKKDLETTPITYEEKPFEIPESWEWVRLDDVTYSVGSKENQIQTKDILKIGNYCVVSQGQNLIDGYSNEEEKVVYDIPLVMFGDHTRNVKYVDFPFIIGADGTKFHKCIKINAKYLFYWMLFVSQKLRNRGYARHYSLLKQEIIPLPPLAEQKRIVSKIEELMPLVEEYGVAQEKLNQLNEALPEALKKSILQQAIQGKLVPQDPKDEPASVLLAQIRKEKEQLVKAGKLKKKDLETTPITDEEKPFEIPESWEWCKIGEFADIINGFTPLRTNPEFWNNGNIAWFTVDDIHEQGRIIKKTNQHISTKALAKNSSRILPIDTLLLCCTASVGEYALTKIPLTTNQQFNGITIRKEYTRLVSPYYLFAIAPQFKGWLLNLAGKTTFNFVSVKKVSELIIPLPPLSEQRRIVGRVEELMELVDGMEGSDW